MEINNLISPSDADSDDDGLGDPSRPGVASTRSTPTPTTTA